MDLPFEVLIYLFKHLPHGDRVAASQTCRSWHEAATDKIFQNKQTICFTKNVQQNEQYISKIFNSQSYQKFTSYSFREIDLENKLSEFWEQNGEYITSLDFDECEMHEKMFVKILNSTQNLESLSVSNCRELFMSASLIDDNSKNICSHSLKKLKKLNLSKNKYLSDALFSRFVSSTQSLEELDLSESPITFHVGLQNKFYPSHTKKNGEFVPSESIFTFLSIFKFFKDNGIALKKLYFNKTLIDGPALISIAELPDLKLTSFQAYQCDQLSGVGIIKLSENQTNLTELNLGKCSKVTDDVLATISKNLTKLKSLDVCHCVNVTNVGAIKLTKLKHLQKLNISGCEITSEGIAKGICRKTNTTLIDLNISLLKLDEHTMIMTSEMLPNLKHLNVNFCLSAVTDKSVQAIFKNLIHLNSLYMKDCTAISDAGLTGMGVDKKASNSTETTSAFNHVLKPEKYHRISLRSRAEEEIVRDANRKKNVRAMCERRSSKHGQGFSLSRLKSLQLLNLSRCNKITDVSLIYALKCNELKSLYLNDCQQISHEGLSHLSKNCPSLENIEFMGCNNVSDDGVKELVHNLHRLKHLWLKDCTLLTDKSVYSILYECKSLKALDITGCRNISPDVADKLYDLPTLHTFNMSKPSPYICNTLTQSKTPQAPPQPKFKLLKSMF